jgi:hypothetical protein
MPQISSRIAFVRKEFRHHRDLRMNRLRLSKVVAVMRAGYAPGMPATGCAPLAALSRRRISDDEITTIASDFTMHRRAPITTADVMVAITRITDGLPSLDDMQRVERRLDAIGCTRSAHC